MGWTVWTDGSGTTGGPAGVGFYAICDDDAFGEGTFTGSLSLPNATNQQAELLAAAFALHSLTELCQGEQQDVTVVSDSEYVVKGWNEQRRRKANVAHWQRLDRAVAEHRSVTFMWTRGHAGTEGNEEADRLARVAREEAKQQAEPPEDVWMQLAREAAA
jgi:ribonuclease HI